MAEAQFVPLAGGIASSASQHRLQVWDSHAGSLTARRPFAGPAPALWVCGLQSSLCLFCAFCLPAVRKQEVG